MTGGGVLNDDSVPSVPVEHLPVGVSQPDWDAEFTAFVGAWGQSLGRTARLLCGDAVRAEELTQLTLVRTYAAWGTARRGEPIAYARRVLANARIDTWRTRRREVLTAPELLPEPEQVQETAEHPRRDEAVLALHRLPAKRRRVVVLRYVVGLTELEVAETLGISRGAVKSAASRGLAQLRVALEATEHGRAQSDERSPR
jgi:RNA polymerase sigma-70 factor (sigma-E family)